MKKTNKEYQKFIEEKYGKPLKEVMYELCVVRDVVPVQGSYELNVPKSTFIYWRSKFRFGPKQRMIDFAEEERERIQDEYKEELGEVNLHREFTYSKHNQSIEGFKEIIERLIELEKYRKIKISQKEHISDFSSMIKINVLEETLNYLDKYINNELQEEYKRELQITEWLSDDN